MARIITFTNQKGGEGKTSLAMNFAVKLRMEGFRVLLVDMDSQCSLTYCMGVDNPPVTVFDLLTRRAAAHQAVVHAAECDIICGSPNLSTADVTLVDLGKEYLLKEALAEVAAQYDFIVIDSPPALGILTVNILTAADCVVIPAQTDVLSLKGVGQLYGTIQSVKRYCNPGVVIAGIVLTRHKGRLRLSRELREMTEQMSQQMGTIVFDASIREAVAVSESHAKRKSIYLTAPNSKQAMDYEQFTMEFLRRSGIYQE